MTAERPDIPKDVSPREAESLASALDRERAARVEAEATLAARSRELFVENERLRRRASASLTALERREANLFHASPIAIFDCDLRVFAAQRGVIGAAPSSLSRGVRLNAANRAGLALLGAGDVDALHTKLGELLSPQLIAALGDFVAAANRGDETFNAALTLTRLDGSLRPVTLYANPALGAEDSFVNVILTVIERPAEASQAPAPVSQPEEDAAPTPEPAEGPAPANDSALDEDSAPLHVLAAEDNVLNQRVLAAMLQALDIKADFVTDGLQAVEAVSQGAYDLILMDICMPRLDGVEATRQIRALPDARCETPIVAVTANAMPSDRKRLIAAGIDDIVPKPIDGGALIQALARWGDVARSRAGTRRVS